MFRIISVLLAIVLHSVAAINAHSASSNLALSSAHAEKKKIKVEISISSEDDSISSEDDDSPNNEDPVTPIEPETPNECLTAPYNLPIIRKFEFTNSFLQ